MPPPSLPMEYPPTIAELLDELGEPPMRKPGRWSVSRDRRPPTSSWVDSVSPFGRSARPGSLAGRVVLQATARGLDFPVDPSCGKKKAAAAARRHHRQVARQPRLRRVRRARDQARERFAFG